MLKWEQQPRRDGCSILTAKDEHHEYEIRQLYEPVDEGNYQLCIDGYFKGVGSHKELKEIAEQGW